MRRVGLMVALLILMLSFTNPSYAVDETINIVPLLSEQHEEALVRSVITVEEETKLAKMLYGEDRNHDNRMKQAAVIWCAFNRAEAWDQSIDYVIRESQFHGYFPEQLHPEWSHELVRDVACRYALERMGLVESGRVLPKEYLYFSAGEDRHNRFRIDYEGTGEYWEWICWNPYE